MVGLMVSCGDDASSNTSENVKPKLREYSDEEVTITNDIMFLKKNMNSNDIFYAKYVNITFILFLVAGMAGQFFNVTQLIFLWFMMFGIYLSRIRGA